VRREIVTVPHPVLTEICEPVTDFDSHLASLIIDLRDTMKDMGVGLAAPQINVPLRVILIKDRPAFINPEIIETDGSWTAPEGCLSIPGTYGEPGSPILVERAITVRVRWQNFVGEWRESSHQSWEARVVQHEIDHLDGILITEKQAEVVAA
jgi:peptide deformylase